LGSISGLYMPSVRACGEFALLWDPVSDAKKMLVECDLESQNASVIGVPETHTPWRHFVPDGGLGFVNSNFASGGKLVLDPACWWLMAGAGLF
jgi:hypothetical protein